MAHIERIDAIAPIEGADRIEKVTVLGWDIVCRKGIHKVGDEVCYIEIDSILPKIELFSFMAERKYRVKTIKLKKQVSQGLIITLDEVCTIIGKKKEFAVGDDVTSLIGVTKYLPESEREVYDLNPKKKHNKIIKFLTRFQLFRSLFHVKSKSFPDIVPKTDEERIQNIPFVLNDRTERTYYTTEKLDGCSATFAYTQTAFSKKFYVASRNVLKFENDNSVWSKMARQLDIKNKLKKYARNIAIQGEIIGEGIQGNKYRLKGQSFFVFNIYDIKNKKYLSFYDARLICSILKLNMVPLLEENYTLPATVKEMVSYSEGKSILDNDVEREGVVVRSKYNVPKRISFKAISPTFLLKHEGENEY